MSMFFDGACIQSAPNFSEGRDPDVIAAIVDAARDIPRVRIPDWSADRDHNRMVVTLVGAPDAVLDATVRMAKAAVERIDLRHHQGAHPRLGAIDVLPYIPLRGVTLEQCAELARTAATELTSRYDLPVFLYEAAAGGRSLPSIRKHAFDDILPDMGPPHPHPTAGAAVVGARMPLVAYNVDLGSNDLALAKHIAREVRAAFPDQVRALGLPLSSRGIVQVSMNIVKPSEVSLTDLMAFITARAPVLRSELIGAMPGYIAFDTVQSALRLTDVRPGQVLLESWPE